MSVQRELPAGMEFVEFFGRPHASWSTSSAVRLVRSTYGFTRMRLKTRGWWPKPVILQHAERNHTVHSAARSRRRGVRPSDQTPSPTRRRLGLSSSSGSILRFLVRLRGRGAPAGPTIGPLQAPNLPSMPAVPPAVAPTFTNCNTIRQGQLIRAPTITESCGASRCCRCRYWSFRAMLY
ncbi:MAG: hypothetical protein JWP83_4984 [Mycobacterium sp.]|jgi:hypothetical protein|nr:hypothetical protein [Mycobacterium sp.]